MSVIPLTPIDLSIAAFLVMVLALTTARMRLAVGRQLAIAAVRTTVQLLLIGLVLRAIFDHVHWAWITLVATVMLLAAGREVMARQKRPLRALAKKNATAFASTMEKPQKQSLVIPFCQPQRQRHALRHKADQQKQR